jgi:hypothetical protein
MLLCQHDLATNTTTCIPYMTDDVRQGIKSYESQKDMF